MFWNSRGFGEKRKIDPSENKSCFTKFHTIFDANDNFNPKDIHPIYHKIIMIRGQLPFLSRPQ